MTRIVVIGGCTGGIVKSLINMGLEIVDGNIGGHRDWLSELILDSTLEISKLLTVALPIIWDEDYCPLAVTAYDTIASSDVTQHGVCRPAYVKGIYSSAHYSDS